jgi:DNA modification methylase
MLHYEVGSGYVFNADCRDVLRDEGYAGSCDFAFLDPPFNIGQEYDVHRDTMPQLEYEDFFRSAVTLSARAVRIGGILCLHVPDSLVDLALETMKLGAWQRIDWVIWHYRFGVCMDVKFIPSKCHCLIYRNSSQNIHTWNPGDIQVPSDRATIYNDDRTPTGFRVPLDVWCRDYDGDFWGRVQGNSAEKVPGHPNQLPELYLDRLIKAYTNAEDLVLDPFAGTGTTATVANALGRRFITIEKSKAYVDDIIKRIQRGMVR